MDEQERAAFAEAVAERVAQRLMPVSLPPGSLPPGSMSPTNAIEETVRAEVARQLARQGSPAPPSAPDTADLETRLTALESALGLTEEAQP